MSVLVLGSSGQLASHLKELLPEADYWGRARFDLQNPAGLDEAIVAAAPSVIVNAAAYTAVDKAESEPDSAWRLNVEAPAAAARAAARLDVPLLHVSTDYVFDGTKAGEYAVADACNPLSVYGRTKLGGELAVRSLAPKHWILRTSWVFSEHGANFVKTILRLAATREELRVVMDQVGRPTYAGDLAALVARMAGGRRPPYGTYHAVGGAAVSWHALAERVVDAAARSQRLARAPRIVAIPTAEYPTAARRPANSVLMPSAELMSSLDVRFDWPSAVERVVGIVTKLR
jgi:dTDP-4-dehydrorhamnose reductase